MVACDMDSNDFLLILIQGQKFPANSLAVASVDLPLKFQWVGGNSVIYCQAC
jgi:hypothetical protein